MPGLVTALSCSDPNLPNGYLDGYQMDSRADYETSWRNFNTWWGFDTSSAQAACPPSSAAAQGLVPWNGKGFPSMQGQVLECETITGDAPVYVWTLPTQDMWFCSGSVLTRPTPGTAVVMRNLTDKTWTVVPDGEEPKRVAPSQRLGVRPLRIDFGSAQGQIL